MTWGIDDIDLVSVVIDAGLFGGDGDSPLVLLIHRVHNQMLTHFGLIFAKSMRLLKKPIYQGGLAVIDMRDNRNIANFTRIRNHT